MKHRLVSLFISLLPFISHGQNVPFLTQFGARLSGDQAASAIEDRNLGELKRAGEQLVGSLERQLGNLQKTIGHLNDSLNAISPEWHESLGDSAMLNPAFSASRERITQLQATHDILLDEYEKAKEIAKRAALAASQKNVAEEDEGPDLMDQPVIEEWYKAEADLIRKQYRKIFAEIDLIADRDERRNKFQLARANRAAEFKSLDEQEADKLRSLVASVAETGWFCLMSGGTRRDVERYFEPYSKNPGGFLSSSTLHVNAADSKASLNSELYYDYFGPLRMGILGQISSRTSPSDSTSADEAEEETVDGMAQRLLGGGGNIIADLSLPLLAYTSHNGSFAVRTMLQPRFALDLQSVDSDSSKVPYNADLGPELYFNVTGNRGVISGFLSWRPSLILGGPAFYERLNRGGYKPIEMNQLRIGIGIANVARISYLFVGGDDFVRERFQSQISIQILTGNFGSN